ncbi:MAG: YlxR family protein [Firmicutes bacterium]|nr:YlxR family protein [Bacillota bacterium]
MSSKTQRTPMRKCVSCMMSYPQNQLIRLTRKGDEIIIDHNGRSEGRGMYMCRNAECIDNMIKRKAFNRACRCNLNQEMLAALHDELLTVLKEGTNVKES